MLETCIKRIYGNRKVETNKRFQDEPVLVGSYYGFQCTDNSFACYCFVIVT